MPVQNQIEVYFDSFPEHTLIVELSGRTYRKYCGAYYWILTNQTDGEPPVFEPFRESDNFEPGSWAAIDGLRYIKCPGDGRWRLVDCKLEDFIEIADCTRDDGDNGEEMSLMVDDMIELVMKDESLKQGEGVGTVLELQQEWYKHGQNVPAARAVFKQPLIFAEFGKGVSDPEAPAFGEHLVPQKASICFGIKGINNNGQRNMRVKEQPISRKHLAYVIAHELRKRMKQTVQDGAKCVCLNGQTKDFKFEDLYLFDVRWVSGGSIQARLGVMDV